MQEAEYKVEWVGEGVGEGGRGRREGAGWRGGGEVSMCMRRGGQRSLFTETAKRRKRETGREEGVQASLRVQRYSPCDVLVEGSNETFSITREEAFFLNLCSNKIVHAS